VLTCSAYLSPVVKYHGLARRYLTALGFLMRPLLNGGKSGGHAMSDREVITRYIDTATRSLDVAVFVGGSLMQDRHENLLAASRRGVQLRFLLADATSGWPDQLARPLNLRPHEYAQRIYVSASRALMLGNGTEVRWQPFPFPWSFMISDGEGGYVKAIDFVVPGELREFGSRDISYYRSLFDRAWSISSSVTEPLVGRADAEPSLKVFLCHASDDKDAVRSLYHRLKRDGVSPWLDDVDIVPGQDWEEAISDAIRQSDVFLVCMSQTSVQKRGFVQRELRAALRVAEEMPAGMIFIVPARLDDCEPPSDLSHLQRVDLFRPEAEGYAKLLRALKVARAHKQ